MNKQVKKLMVLVGASLMLTACGDKSDTKKINKDDTNQKLEKTEKNDNQHENNYVAKNDDLEMKGDFIASYEENGKYYYLFNDAAGDDGVGNGKLLLNSYEYDAENNKFVLSKEIKNFNEEIIDMYPELRNMYDAKTNKLFTATNDNELFIYDLTNNKEEKIEANFFMNNMQMLNDDVVAGYYGYYIFIYNMKTKEKKNIDLNIYKENLTNTSIDFSGASWSNSRVTQGINYLFLKENVLEVYVRNDKDEYYLEYDLDKDEVKNDCVLSEKLDCNDQSTFSAYYEHDFMVTDNYIYMLESTDGKLVRKIVSRADFSKKNEIAGLENCQILKNVFCDDNMYVFSNNGNYKVDLATAELTPIEGLEKIAFDSVKQNGEIVYAANKDCIYCYDTKNNTLQKLVDNNFSEEEKVIVMHLNVISKELMVLEYVEQGKDEISMIIISKQ